ncbi:hypothetical protein ELI_1086 [Eubacterium callanderi]|uniref:Uncharacterized protein n=1 Tax=Eubacterium callanderi TaxID=53442 RepID=E3GKN6_9FIRM|nr:hypothetical protein ELI_1086 [Eubacterium callanderi]
MHITDKKEPNRVFGSFLFFENNLGRRSGCQRFWFVDFYTRAW